MMALFTDTNFVPAGLNVPIYAYAVCFNYISSDTDKSLECLNAHMSTSSLHSTAYVN